MGQPEQESREEGVVSDSSRSVKGFPRNREEASMARAKSTRRRILAEEFREDLGFVGHEELSYFEFGGSHEEF